MICASWGVTSNVDTIEGNRVGFGRMRTRMGFGCSKLQATLESRAMQNSPKKPLSVRLMQVGLGLGIASLIIGLLVSLYLCLSLDGRRQCLSPLPAIIPQFVGLLFALTLAILTFRGLEQRKAYGKWLSVLFLIPPAIAGLIQDHYTGLIYQMVVHWQALPTPPYECWYARSIDGNFQRYCGYKSYWELAWRCIPSLLQNGLMLWTSLRLLFSRSAKRYFKSTKQ